MQHLYQSNSPSQTSYAHGSVSRQRQNQTRTSQGVVTEIHARSIVATSIQPRANYARFSESAVSNESSSYHASNFNTLAAQDYAPHRPSDHENSLFGTRSPQELPHTSSLNAENVVPSDSGNVSNYFALGRPWDISTSHAAGLNQHGYIADDAQAQAVGPQTQDHCAPPYQVEFQDGVIGLPTFCVPSGHNDVGTVGIGSASRELYDLRRSGTAQIPDLHQNTPSSSTSTMSPAKSPRVTHAGATSGIPTCNECGQTFGRIWDLQRHQHSATVHKPQALRWRCGICKIAFTRRDSCLRHLDSQHGRQISYYEAWPAPV